MLESRCLSKINTSQSGLIFLSDMVHSHFSTLSNTVKIADSSYGFPSLPLSLQSAYSISHIRFSVWLFKVFADILLKKKILFLVVTTFLNNFYIHSSLLRFCPHWVALPSRLVTLTWLEFFLFSPLPVHFIDFSALSFMPWSLQGPVIYRFYHRMTRKHLTDRMISFITFSMQSVLYSFSNDLMKFCIWYLRRDLSVFDKAGPFFYSFPHANFCLHDLLPLTWHCAYPQDLGYVAPSAELQELTEDSGTMQWWHGSKIEKKKKGGKTEGRRDRVVRCEGWKRPCWRLATGYVWHPSLWRTDEITLTFFSFQLKLHYHKDLMLGRSPYYSQGDLSSILLRASFCSLLFSVTLSEGWNLLYSLLCIIY